MSWETARERNGEGRTRHLACRGEAGASGQSGRVETAGTGCPTLLRAPLWKRSIALLAPLLLICVPPRSIAAQPATNSIAKILLVRGADGEAAYASVFDRQVEQWQAVAQQAGAQCKVIGGTSPPEATQVEAAAEQAPASTTNDLEQLEEAISRETKVTSPPLWLVLIGHGTFDGRQARFNLRGPDLSAGQLATWLKPAKRPLVIINTSATSAPFLAALTGPDRVVITATRSGNEQSYARFGEFLAGAMAAPAADLDQDGQTSLLEAFLSASSKVAEFYQTEGRLATEHALIDDNGDGLGTPADWFRGIRAVQRAQDNRALDGARAHQLHLVLSEQEQSLSPEVRTRRDDLERQLFELREEKEKLPEVDYYARLEKLLLEIAEAYEEDTPSTPPGSSGE